MMTPMASSLEIARNDLAVYASMMWPEFQLAPHHRLIVDELERVDRGRCDRLMISLPPRHGKTMLVQFFAAWFLGRHPGRSVITTSYGAELAEDSGRRIRGLVNSPLHHAIFPNCRTVNDSNAAHRFGLIAGGNFFAVGAGGVLTGRGADLLLIDDPIKSREQAYSSAERRSLQAWYGSTAYTRLQPGGAVILIQTRWHQDDLAGWLLREHTFENWRVVSLPATAEPGDPLGRGEGAPLWPERFSRNDLDRIRAAVGSAAWASLYQQRPTLDEGAVFKRQWWRSYTNQPTHHQRLILSLDTAFKAKKSADYSVIEIWGEGQDGYYLLHVWRERVEFPALKKQVVLFAENWKPNAVLVEDAASGQSLLQALQSETRLPVLGVKPLGDKLARAAAVSPLIESGRVFFPASAGWLADFMDEVSSFPASPHDDMVDCLSQALAYLRESYFDSKTWQETAAMQRAYFAQRQRLASGSFIHNVADLYAREDGIVNPSGIRHTMPTPRRRFGGF